MRGRLGVAKFAWSCGYLLAASFINLFDLNLWEKMINLYLFNNKNRGAFYGVGSYVRELVASLRGAVSVFMWSICSARRLKSSDGRRGRSRISLFRSR